MWDLFEYWVISLAVLWSVWTLLGGLLKSNASSCKTLCQKKIFSKPSKLVSIGKKIKA